MDSETKRRRDAKTRYRHPATCLLMGLILSSYLTLNFWNPNGSHGFPLTWVHRSVPDDELAARRASAFSPFAYYGRAPQEKPKSRGDWSRFRAALPLEWFTGDFSRVTSFSYLNFLISATVGACLFVFPLWWFDRLFGRRAQPFYRFGLGRLLLGISLAAVLFALATESRVLFVAKAIVILAVPAIWLGISTWVVERERAIVRDVARRRRERRAARAAAQLNEPEPL